MKIESITYKTLKKLLKFSIAIDVELGFYISYHGTITIDQFKNQNPNKTKIYKYSKNDIEDILRLINAYAKLFNHSLSVC